MELATVARQTRAKLAVLSLAVLPLAQLSLAVLPENAMGDEASAELARGLTELATSYLPAELPEEFADQTWRNLRARGDEANRQDLEAWRAIRSREDWERLRDERLARLKAALGTFPTAPEPLEVYPGGVIEGEGFVIENLVYRSRPGLWVTANLYAPAKPDHIAPGKNPPAKMPGILIVHSHHQPKTQSELQDMGMTWARRGCLVLVIDQLGHGERADHPFRGQQDYTEENFRPSRQDYHFRYDTNTQLSLVGESLMGWMAWDLMRGVDLLLSRPGVDRAKILLLGAVAGGGDPAGVTAALDPRIAAAAPFNFGGPQPETKYPLPADAEESFNYLGGAYWEGTRNLRRTGVDGFLHWTIVASLAPRGLIYAHEFAWDEPRDPVWKRLNAIYEMYDAGDMLDYAHGRGSVRGQSPESTHCTNIGRHHRQRIHAALRRWFAIDVSPDDEYSRPRDPAELRSMTEAARAELRPRKLYELLTDISEQKIKTVRERLDSLTPAARRGRMQAAWSELLGDIEPRAGQSVVSQSRAPLAETSIGVERVALQTEPGIVVPLLLLSPAQRPAGDARVIVAVAQAGPAAFLRERADAISQLLSSGATVCLPLPRECGTARGTYGDGPNGSTSHYALFFETPLLGYRLRDLRSVLGYLRARDDLRNVSFTIWGDSFTPPNPPDARFEVPKQVSQRPAFSEPLGGLLALLAGLYEDDVRAVYIHGGLSEFHAVLGSPYVYVAHDAIAPGALNHGDLADLAAALAPRPLRFDALVDGHNRALSVERARTIYEPTTKAYRAATSQALTFSADRTDCAAWMLQAAAKP